MGYFVGWCANKGQQIWSRARGCGKLSSHFFPGQSRIPRWQVGDTGNPRKSFCSSSGGKTGPKVPASSSGRRRKNRVRRWCRGAGMWRGWRHGSWGGAGGCLPSPLSTHGLPSGSELGLCCWSVSVGIPIPAALRLQAAPGEWSEWAANSLRGPTALLGLWSAGAQSGGKTGKGKREKLLVKETSMIPAA